MTENGDTAAEPVSADLQETLEEIEYTGRKPGPVLGSVIAGVAFLWSLFQLWIASPLPSSLLLISVQKRSIHLAFALFLCFLMFPIARRFAHRRIPLYDIVLALLAAGAALYLFLAYRGLVTRQGILLDISVAGVTIPFEAILGGVGIVLLLEATRRSIGIPLVLVAAVFLLYSVLGPDIALLIAVIGTGVILGGIVQVMKGRLVVALPLIGLGLVIILYAYLGESVQDLLAHKGLSLKRLIGYHWLGGEAIFGIPIDVSVSFVFLFVLFGALLDKAGAGKYFIDLAFAMVGKYRGGPAKAAILASGMTGAISGSSIANVVTTGTFTIPVMRSMGLPAVKAGAIEVAASTNGQIMPPIMGAAAFIIAEFIGVSYFDVVKAAIVPALTSYIALLYISHMEALKLGLRGLPKADIPRLGRTFISGLHYLVPIIILIHLLMVERWTAGSAVFWSILSLMVIVVLQHLWPVFRGRDVTFVEGLRAGALDIFAGMVAGARNMVTIGVAVAAAGIIVGAVSSTGLNNALVGVVEAISGGNIYILLVMTAVLCIVLGMGLPTTANYIVVASLLAGVVVELGSAAGLVLPLISVHLFVFYFGLMADSTPPVCLAAFAASAISRADPLETGVQSFLYDIRTGILPFIFIFNPELLLVGVTSWWQGIMVFVVSVIAMFCFSSVTQGWYIVKVRWYEALALLAVMIALFRPDFVMNQVFPPFVPLDTAQFVAGKAQAPAGYTIRIHLTRETDYGDRLKLYRLATPEIAPDDAFGLYGLSLERTEDGRFAVSRLRDKGEAKKVGVHEGDILTAVDVEQVGLPSRRWAYLPAAFLLALVTWLQLRRRKRGKPRLGPAAAATA